MLRRRQVDDTLQVLLQGVASKSGTARRPQKIYVSLRSIGLAIYSGLVSPHLFLFDTHHSEIGFLVKSAGVDGMFATESDIQDYFIREEVRLARVRVNSVYGSHIRLCNDMKTGASLPAFTIGVGRGGIKFQKQASIMLASCQGPPGSKAAGKN